MSNQNDQPLVSIDVVPVRFSKFDRTLQVAVGGRLYEPFKGEYALPGVLLVHERAQEAAYRALREKVDIQADQVLNLLQTGVFDTTDRDPRGPTLAVAFAAVVESDGRRVPGIEWRRLTDLRFTITEAGEVVHLPFDHDQIVASAVEQLGLRIWTDTALTRALLGEEFSTRDAIELTEALRGAGTADRTNFNRTLKAYPHLVSDGTVEGGVGRRSLRWRFIG